MRLYRCSLCRQTFYHNFQEFCYLHPKPQKITHYMPFLFFDFLIDQGENPSLLKHWNKLP